MTKWVKHQLVWLNSKCILFSVEFIDIIELTINGLMNTNNKNQTDFERNQKLAEDYILWSVYKISFQ